MLKLIRISIIWCLLCSPFLLFAQKVEFFKGSWEEVQKQARKEGKYIFVDAYTDWCYWCKVQDKKTFTHEAVAALLNREFIPVKLNFEDSVNIPLAMKFRVSSFPTILIFNAKGQLVKRIVGYTENPDVFIGKLNEALSIKEEQVYGFDSRQLNLDFPDFYKRSYGMGGKRVFPPDSVVFAYLDKQTDLFGEVNFSILNRFSMNEKYQQFLLDNHVKLKKIYGKEEVNGLLENIVYHKVEAAAKAGATEEKFWEITEYCNFYTQNTDEVIPGLKLFFYESVPDWPSYFFTAQEYVKSGVIKEAGELNGICWKLYENLNDILKLRAAASWMEKFPVEDQDYAFLDTYAALLFKSRQYPKAEKIAELAIKKGKKNGDKVEETEKLLEKIQTELMKK